MSKRQSGHQIDRAGSRTGAHGESASPVGESKQQLCRIVLADDHTLVRQSLTLLIDAEPDLRIVAQVARGDQLLAAARRSQPDVVVTDISMPGLDGLTVAAQLREEAPDVKIVFLTMHDDEWSVRQALDLRADGYVVKSADFEELLVALRTVAAGGTYLSPAVSHRVAAMVVAGRGRDLHRLTDREREVLRLLADGHRPGDMAEELVVSVKTVRNHLSNIYGKLEVGSAHQAVAEARRRGLLAAS